MPHSSARFPMVPLKTMDPSQLTFELLSRMQRFDEDGREMVASAAQLASHLHRGQTRRWRDPMPRVPYIEHPLRVALRTMRWGGVSPELVAAALLHDSVEDCAERIVLEEMPRTMPEAAGEAQRLVDAACSDAIRAIAMRDLALGYMGISYSDAVARTIGDVTNDPTGLQPYDEKFAALVRSAGTAGKIVKASDLVDNAGSLRHQHGHVPDAMVEKLLVKYWVPVELLGSELERVAREEGPLPSCFHAVEPAAEHLRSVQASMEELADEMSVALPMVPRRNAPDRAAQTIRSREPGLLGLEEDGSPAPSGAQR